MASGIVITTGEAKQFDMSERSELLHSQGQAERIYKFFRQVSFLGRDSSDSVNFCFHFIFDKSLGKMTTPLPFTFIFYQNIVSTF